MQLIRRHASILILLGFLLPRLAAAASLAPLPAPSLGESWFSIAMGDARVGFAHTTLREAPGGYEVTSEWSTRLVVLGFSREASSRETYLVNRDLSLRSFVVEETISGVPMHVEGGVVDKEVRVTVTTAEKRRVTTLKARGKVYPPPLLNLYPLMQGFREGKKYRLQMFDPEEAKLKEVIITALKKETLPGAVATLHLRNDLYPFVDNDIWVDLTGNTVRESVRDGLIVTSTEPGEATRRFIVEAAIAKRDPLLQFSLVRVDRPIARPAELKGMTVEVSGFPDGWPLFSGGGQRAQRMDGGRVVFTEAAAPPSAEDGGGEPENGRWLPKTPEDGELLARKDAIIGGEKEPLKVVEKLTSWVATDVAESADDSRSPLETLRLKKGNCQSRAGLYAALARAAGIPTRLAAGLVYVAGKGFLFHCWAESRTGGEWLAVDPNLGQVPADATHVKLAEGGSLEEMAFLAGVVGRLTAKLVAETY